MSVSGEFAGPAHLRHLEGKSIPRLLWSLSLPATVGMLVMASYNIVDTIFVGHFVGVRAIAGLTIVFPVQMLVMAICQTIGMGGSILVSMELGKKNHLRARTALAQVFSLTAIFGAAFTLFVLLAADPLLAAFGASGSVLPPARTYLTSMALGYWPFGASVALNGLARAEGNARLAMTTMILSAGVNVVLDALFIGVLGWGIAGAAWATVAANWCSFLFLVVYFRSSRACVRLDFSRIAPDLRAAAEIFRLGSSTFARNAASSLLAVVVNHVLARTGAELHLAIYGLQHRLVMFLFMPLFGIAQGLQPILGYHEGAKNPKKVLEAVHLGMWVSSGFAILAFLVFQLFPGPLLRIFTSSPDLVRNGVVALRILSGALPLVGYHVVSVTMFQSLGLAGPAFFLSMTRQVLFFIPLVLILPSFLGVWGVWVSYPAADVLSFLVTFSFTQPQLRRLHERIGKPAAPPAAEAV